MFFYELQMHGTLKVELKTNTVVSTSLFGVLFLCAAGKGSQNTFSATVKTLEKVAITKPSAFLCWFTVMPAIQLFGKMSTSTAFSHYHLQVTKISNLPEDVQTNPIVSRQI